MIFEVMSSKSSTILSFFSIFLIFVVFDANELTLYLLSDEIKPTDVGLKPELPYFRENAARKNPAITYLHIHECDKFSVSYFP